MDSNLCGKTQERTKAENALGWLRDGFNVTTVALLVGMPTSWVEKVSRGELHPNAGPTPRKDLPSDDARDAMLRDGLTLG